VRVGHELIELEGLAPVERRHGLGGIGRVDDDACVSVEAETPVPLTRRRRTGLDVEGR
jgi:hypothetical protein